MIVKLFRFFRLHGETPAPPAPGRTATRVSPRPALDVLDVAGTVLPAGIALRGGAAGATDLLGIDDGGGHADGMVDVTLRPAVRRQVHGPAAQVQSGVLGGIAVAGGADERDLLPDVLL